MTKVSRISTKLIKMREDEYKEMEELSEEDRFKKIEVSSDCTDLMSDFSDK